MLLVYTVISNLGLLFFLWSAHLQLKRKRLLIGTLNSWSSWHPTNRQTILDERLGAAAVNIREAELRLSNFLLTGFKALDLSRGDLEWFSHLSPQALAEKSAEKKREYEQVVKDRTDFFYRYYDELAQISLELGVTLRARDHEAYLSSVALQAV